MSYRSVRKELAKQTDGEYRCRVCNDTAAFETLSSYGGRCGRCYADYCRVAMPPRVDVGDKRKSLLDWAHALKRRHAAGDRLTPAQIAAYTAALKLPSQPSALPFD